MNPIPLKISGMGRYLPRRIVSNDEVEDLAQVPRGTIDNSAAGVKTRRWAEDDETSSIMGAKAAHEALREAGLDPSELDLIINASGTQEQVVPDGGPLIQRELGLGGSGIACFSVHSTCLSFLSAMGVAAGMLASGQSERILIVSSDVAIRHIMPSEIELFSLIGDLAAAVVVTRPGPEETSRLEAIRFETFGKDADLTYCNIGTRVYPGCPEARPEDNYFHMRGREVYVKAVTQGATMLEHLRPGLSKGLDDIDLVVPHQASGMALRSMLKFGWPEEKMIKTLDWLGNTNSSSMPGALYEAKATGRLQRGQKILLAGTGAGLSLGGAILTY